MVISTIGPLLVFVTASTITPGPNSIMIMASGVNFGFRKTVPHILGVAVGITIVITLAGIGLGAILDLLLWLSVGMLFTSAAYLLYLAWKIAKAAPVSETDGTGTPFTFLQAMGFQWVNPKVWAVGMAAVAIFAPQYIVSNVIIVALAFAVVGLVSNTSWAWFGTVIRRFLSSRERLRVFNLCAALALVASLIPAFLWP
jgi:threonine/homoserine/homoserine lactone efflux protein